MTEGYAAFDDPYLYPGTTVLRNRLDLRDPQQLDAFEMEMTTERAAGPLPVGRFGPAHYRRLHHHLFQDVYAWAGRYRTVRTAKGNAVFCYPEHIPAQMKLLFTQLAAAPFTGGAEFDSFVVAAARFLGELNAIHPFREGNGRVQLLFLNQVARRAGNPLDLGGEQRDRFLPAMIDSFHQRLALLIKEAVSPSRLAARFRASVFPPTFAQPVTGDPMPHAFLCTGVRSPFGRYGGALSGMRADDLAAHPLKVLMAREAGVDWARVDDVVYGCVNQAGEDNRNVARMALLLAGLPDAVPGATVNRLCGSGLEAMAVVARGIVAGETTLGIAGGVESMSRAPFVMPKATAAFAREAKVEDTTIGWRFVNPAMKAKYGVEAMGETAENVAAEHQVSRADQDAFALRSQQRAGRAMKSGVLAAEIAPVTLPGPKGTSKVVEHDEHPRPDTTAEQLAKLAPAFREGGTVTAGNSSGVNDGSVALLVASEAAARANGLTPRARIVGAAVAGVPPRVMGIGPVPATRKLLARLGLKIGDMDVIELNEAFAAQGIACLRELGLPDDADQVNPNGGAIALGHPLGASGGRMILAAVNELHRRQGTYALCTMCIGVGQGIALVLERV